MTADETTPGAVALDTAPKPAAAGDPLLTVTDLVQRFKVPGGMMNAVAGVSFELGRGRTLGLVGESGCGKSTLARAILQLTKPTSGSVMFDGQDLTTLPKSGLREMRRRIQMVFQDPISALNPRRRIKDIVAEGLVIAGTPQEEIAPRVEAVLRQVGLDPALVSERRPHQFSGGQCQRIAIARAMVVDPDLLICDEPVASLDVSVQAQVLDLLDEMKTRTGVSMIFVAHDLAVVRNISDDVAVMYLGTICETGDTQAIYDTPAHPYTRALLDAVPTPDPGAAPAGPALTGEIPSPMNPPSGCRFRTRCPIARDECAEVVPVLREVAPGHRVACHFPLVGDAAVLGGTGAAGVAATPDADAAAAGAAGAGAQTREPEAAEVPAGTGEDRGKAEDTAEDTAGSAAEPEDEPVANADVTPGAGAGKAAAAETGADREAGAETKAGTETETGTGTKAEDAADKATAETPETAGAGTGTDAGDRTAAAAEAKADAETEAEGGSEAADSPETGVAEGEPAAASPETTGTDGEADTADEPKAEAPETTGTEAGTDTTDEPKAETSETTGTEAGTNVADKADTDTDAEADAGGDAPAKPEADVAAGKEPASTTESATSETDAGTDAGTDAKTDTGANAGEVETPGAEAPAAAPAKAAAKTPPRTAQKSTAKGGSRTGAKKAAKTPAKRNAKSTAKKRGGKG